MRKAVFVSMMALAVLLSLTAVAGASDHRPWSQGSVRLYSDHRPW